MPVDLQEVLVRLDRIGGHLDGLRTGIEQSVAIAPRDPDMALVRVRRVLEHVVRDVFQRRLAEPPGTRPLEELLQRLVRAGAFPVHLEAYATAIRKLGNVGAHGLSTVGVADVYQSLSQLLPILEWYFREERTDVGNDAPESDGRPVLPAGAAARPAVGNRGDDTPDPEAAPPQKFFISYSRAEESESALALDIKQRIEAAGRSCFIDVGMAPGIHWVEEIQRRLQWCDVFTVLLSDNSVHSEMVLTEVRVARRLQQTTGRPQIVPVRLDYSGPLGYELNLHIGQLQYLSWSAADQTPLIVDRILSSLPAASLPPGEAVSDSREATPQPAERGIGFQPVGDDTNVRPDPHRDLRVAAVPGGTIRATDPCYIQRSEDGVVGQYAEDTGMTLVIKGPRQLGKSSLLMQYLSACQKQGKRIAFIDLSVFSGGDLGSYERFLSQFAAALLQRLGMDTAPAKEVDSQFSMIEFLEHRILAQSQVPVVIALDEADRLFGQSYQTDFFSMLRMWHNNRSSFLSPDWEQLDLAMVISTEPYLLIDEGDRSPFNVGLIVELLPFDLAACRELNARHHDALTNEQVEELFLLLGGQPYLTRLAYYRLLGPRPMEFHALVEQAAEEHGPFGDHLRALLFKLHEIPELLEAMRHVIETGAVAQHDVYYRLHGAGLVRRSGQRVNPSNVLYARYFRNSL